MLTQAEKHVARLSWNVVDECIKSGAYGILPIGAESKEHGFHLPNNTDWLQAEWLANKAAELSNGLIWPTLNYGYYPAFVDYPGSISLSSETFEALVSDIVKGIYDSGVHRVLIINTGISTIQPLERVAADYGNRLFLHHMCEATYYSDVSKRIAKQPHGSHADEIETSKMLWLAPEVVDMAKAQPSPLNTPMQRGPFSRTNSQHANYSPSGVYGDPRLATLEKGELIIQAMVKDLAAIVTAVTSP